VYLSEQPEIVFDVYDSISAKDCKKRNLEEQSSEALGLGHVAKLALPGHHREILTTKGGVEYTV
jgi:hypothetical protein